MKMDLLADAVDERRREHTERMERRQREKAELEEGVEETAEIPLIEGDGGDPCIASETKENHRKRHLSEASERMERTARRMQRIALDRDYAFVAPDDQTNDVVDVSRVLLNIEEDVPSDEPSRVEDVSAVWDHSPKVRLLVIGLIIVVVAILTLACSVEVVIFVNSETDAASVTPVSSSPPAILGPVRVLDLRCPD